MTIVDSKGNPVASKKDLLPGERKHLATGDRLLTIYETKNGARWRVNEKNFNPMMIKSILMSILKTIEPAVQRQRIVESKSAIVKPAGILVPK